MKKTYLLLLFVFSMQLGFSQVDPNPLNMSLLSQVQYNTSLNDVWGWAAADGTEYALVGLRNGVSIVSLADPENAVEVQFIPGPNSTWRDIKTWGDFAYVTNETSNGVAVIDLSDLPNSAPAYDWTPTIEGLGTLSSCHNLYIDEFGYVYLTGCNLNSGGVLFVDAFSDPGNPQFVGAGEAIYSHDVYARDNKLYTSEIYIGRFGVYDVSDKTGPVLLGAQTTPSEFTHNTWLNDAGDVLFTTDERPNAPVGAYDISDLNNIVELDQYRPIETLGASVIPHNVHVWNDWLVISYYTDGGIIVDASRPGNLIEVGNFDTFLGGDGGFSGAWGLYPFLPSGIVLVSDIGNGLYVLDADYVRACWLEGTVTDANTSAQLNGVDIHIDSEQANQATTGIQGTYETGQALSGTFDVTFVKAGYETKTVSADLENGEVTLLNVELTPLPSFTITGQTIRNSDGDPVPSARILIANEELSFDALSDNQGNFTIENVFEGTYDIFVGAWGYLHLVDEDVNIASASPLVYALDQGYQDDFILDLDWSTDASGTTSTGFWERGLPMGTSFNGQNSNTGADIAGDLGDLCYMTQNGGGGAGDFDVDGGSVTLTSPVMDLSEYNDPILTYYSWFFNDGGNSQPNDAFIISVSNGTDEVVLEEITQSSGNWRPQSEFQLANFIEITDQMQIIFFTSDFDPNGHIVEAAVDAFLVEDRMPNATVELDDSQARIEAYPNPFGEQLNVRYELNEPFSNAYLNVYNSLGQKMRSIELGHTSGQLELGDDLHPGLYLLQIEADGKISRSVKVLKTQ